jgi:hypothetical protein
MFPWAVLVVLAGACFARLAADPRALIVDGRRPSVDYANRGDPRPVGNDLIFLFLPHHWSIGQRLRQFGHWPFWDARGFAGRPLVGNPQSGMFYPPVWAVWWVQDPAALGWLTVAHLLWGGLGVWVLIRSMGQARWAATVAAGTYLASPLLLAHTFEGHYPHVWAACWYPWAFWAYRALRSGRTCGLLLLPPLLALTYLTGHPQEWLLLVLVLSTWAVVDGLGAWPSRGLRASARRILVWVGVVALSLGMVAVDLAPQWALRPWLRRNHDPGLAVGIPQHYHLGGLNAFQMLSPIALGGPSDYFGDDNYWETVFSIGLAPLVLALIAAARYPDRPLVRGWLVLAGLATWFACGRRLGLYAVVNSLVPGMSWFRVPARSLFLANLAGAVLAGLGVAALRNRSEEPRAWRRPALRLACALSLVIGLLFLIQLGLARQRPALAAARVLQDGRFWLTLSGLAALLLLGCFAPWRRNPCLAGGLLGLLGMIELGWYGYALLQVAPARQFLGPDRIAGALGNGSEKFREGEAPSEPDPTTYRPEARPPEGSPWRCQPVRIKARDSFYGDLAAVIDGIEKTNVDDAFQLDHAAALYEALYPVASRVRPMVDRLLSSSAKDTWRRIRQAVLDRMSVTHLVSDRVESDPGWPVVAEGIGNGSRFVIQRNPTAMPRAYVVPRATILPEHAGVVLSSLCDFDPHTTVLMSRDPLEAAAARPEPGAHPPLAIAEWTSTDPDRPALLVTTRALGLLVVADSWMPGWTATVDGRPAPVLRGNYAQRVIPLSKPGRHRIVMDYRPPGFASGSAITMVSVLTWVLIAAFRVRTSGGQGRTGLLEALVHRGPTGRMRRPSPNPAFGITQSLRPTVQKRAIPVYGGSPT